MKWLVPLAAVAAFALVSARADDPDPAAVEKEVNQAAAALREQLKASLAKIDAAITTATKEGGLKPSTEAYFRDCLSHFQTSPAGLTEADRVYFPPRFDSTPAIEPINLAWADLRAEYTREQREQETLFARLAGAAGGALTEAARTAHGAADFASVLKLVKEMEDFSDPGRVRRTSYNDPDEKEQISAYRNTASAMGEALDAVAAHDQAHLAGAFSRLGIGTSNSRNTRVPAIAGAEAIFRARMLQPYRDEAAAAQTKLEDALMARQPAAALDPLLTAYTAAHKRLAEVIGPYDREAQVNAELPRYYERIAQALEALAQHDTSSRPDLSSGREDLGLVHPATFRAFTLQLAHDLHRRENGGPTGDSEPADEASALAKTRADVAAKIDAVQTPEQAAALVETLGPMSEVTARQSSASQNLRNQLAMAEQALRQITTSWAAGQLTVGQEPGFFRNETNMALLLPIARLYQRALRDSLARQHHLPELKQPPAAEMSVADALRSLAEAASDKGDWKKALQLLELLQTPENGRPNSRVYEQTQAIRSYLTALNFEQAEQYGQAILALQRVLMTVADHVPLTESTAKLKQFRTDQPEAFKNLPPMAADPRMFLDQ